MPVSAAQGVLSEHRNGRANPDHKHDFMPDDIIDAMRAFGGWDLVRNEDRNENIEYSFFSGLSENGRKGTAVFLP